MSYSDPTTENFNARQTPGKTVLVVDTAVEGYQSLIEGLDQDTELILLSDGGMDALAEALEGYGDIDTLHILSHGSQGQVQIGNDLLSSETLDDYSDALERISASLSPDGEICLYGCSVGEDSGREFIRALALATGADVAASDDLTGALSLGGDWDLEVATARMDADLPFSEEALAGFSGVLDVPADDTTFDFSSGWTDGGTTLTNDYFTISGVDSRKVGERDMEIVDNSYAHWNDGELNSTGNYFTVTADGDVDSFRLTEVVVSMLYGYSSFGDIYIEGHVLEGGTVTSVIKGGTGESVTFTGDDLSAFSGVSLTSFEVFFSEADSQSIRTNAFLFNSFTVTSFNVPSDPPPPAITSATYDAETGTLVVTGTNLLTVDGDNNDIDVSKLTLTGEGGATYTLDNSSDVDITDATSFTVTLSAADRAGVNDIINSNGTASTDGTVYNLAAAEDWAAGEDPAEDVVDLTGNGITVSNVPVPAITGATYNAATGTLVVTGTNLLKADGAGNDIDVSKLTLTGEGGETYTLDNSQDVDITSPTSFTVTLSDADRASVNAIINKDGTTSTDNTTYNLAAAEDWAAGANPDVDAADTLDNGISVSNVAAPAITEATYNAETGTLVVTGTNLVRADGDSNDIDVSKLILTGEDGETYRLDNSANVEITSGTSFSVTLSDADRAGVNAIINRNGTASNDGTIYNLSAAEDWAAGADPAVDVADTTGNGITVSGVPAPAITGATYDASTGTLVVTGTNLLEAAGDNNDIDVSKLTLTGEGGETYTLDNSADVEITSTTFFTVTLSDDDRAGVNAIINKDGTASTDGTAYNLAAAEDWAAGADSAEEVADLTGNGISVSNVAAPAITSATYNASTGTLVVAGTNLVEAAGDSNDIDVSKLTLTGEDGATYTLIDSQDVEITSGTSFTVILSDADKAGVNGIINKEGTASTGNTVYNLAAAEDWAAGADPDVDVVDTTGNGITVTNVAAPAITEATYTKQTGTLTVTGSSFFSLAGEGNDIEASAFTVTGKGGVTYTLTDTADVDITSSTEFSLLLSATDKAGVEALLDTAGTQSSDTTIYNLAGAEDWNRGADTAVNIADTTNGITADLTKAPSNSGGSGSSGGSTPDDNDGAAAAGESQAPALGEDGATGDGNGDGIQDSVQASVASVSFLSTDHISTDPDAPETYVTLVADAAAGKEDLGDDSSATLHNVQQIDAPDDLPAGASIPLGLISFEADIESAGATESFSLYVDDSLLVNGYWKQDHSGTWVNLASEEYGGTVVTEGGKIRLDFQITDGGQFDSDGEADGVITDPGGAGYLSNTTLFDEAYYLNSKLSQLLEEGGTQYASTAEVKEAITGIGMTTYEHFLRYSLTEDTDPSAYFDTGEYMAAKTAQLNETAYQGRTDWTLESTTSAFEAAGFTNALEHFQAYGWQEDVNPSDAFDVSDYLSVKAEQAGMTVDEVTEAFVACGLDPLSHWEAYGQFEENVCISAVSSGESATTLKLLGVQNDDATLMSWTAI